jgi:hypothetical protein
MGYSKTSTCIREQFINYSSNNCIFQHSPLKGLYNKHIDAQDALLPLEKNICLVADSPKSSEKWVPRRRSFNFENGK